MHSHLVSTSKLLSLVLRHCPEAIGLTLDEQGWANVDDLLEKARERNQPITRELLLEVVQQNDKQRFALSKDGTRIRANQGHSVSVNLGLEPREPPAVLYHGTATRFLESIFAQGLRPQNRHHVHLSSDRSTALRVGQRHGQPVILDVDAAAMRRDGQLFYCSENGVWLCDRVPPRFLSVTDSSQ
ncbi:MAG: RNA 2'-phosphotransferase [Cyanobacteria bacterium P01_A01_bin.3]